MAPSLPNPSADGKTMNSEQMQHAVKMMTLFQSLTMLGHITLHIVGLNIKYCGVKKDDSASLNDILKACHLIVEDKDDPGLGQLGQLFLSQWKSRLAKLSAVEKHQTLQGFRMVLVRLQMPHGADFNKPGPTPPGLDGRNGPWSFEKGPAYSTEERRMMVDEVKILPNLWVPKQ